MKRENLIALAVRYNGDYNKDEDLSLFKKPEDENSKEILNIVLEVLRSL